MIFLEIRRTFLPCIRRLFLSPPLGPWLFAIKCKMELMHLLSVTEKVTFYSRIVGKIIAFWNYFAYLNFTDHGSLFIDPQNFGQRLKVELSQSLSLGWYPAHRYHELRATVDEIEVEDKKTIICGEPCRSVLSSFSLIIFVPHHGFAVPWAVLAFMQVLPTRTQLSR